MGIFKLELPTGVMFTHFLEAGGRRLLAWNAFNLRLPSPGLSTNVIRADRRFETRARDSQLVADFRARLRQTEDLLGKLTFSLREIYRA
jgi:hypothetical protein